MVSLWLNKQKTRSKIQIGDRFVKTDEPKTVWVVAARGSTVDPIPHYQVVQEGCQSRRRTLSELVLLDRDYYRRAETQST
jgi:hypothetical protein